MKITKEHRAYIKTAICKVSGAPTLHSYTSRGLSEKRWMWDLLYMAKISPWLCDNIYPYANDEHISAALKSILGAEYKIIESI